MTAKEKAKELVQKYSTLLFFDLKSNKEFLNPFEKNERLKEDAKQCALIAVDFCESEIITSIESLRILDIKLKIPKAKYISYDKTVKMLKVKYGEDLSPEDEKALDKKFPDTIVFVHSWPVKLKPFYIMPKDEKVGSKIGEGFDAIYKGLEISSGGQRVHMPELLIQMLRKKKLNPKNFKSYVDSFRFGAPIHSGWSIGLERLTQLLTGQENIREACMFPRDRDRLTP